MAVVDDSPPITPAQQNLLQQVVGVFLFYARAVDSTMLVPLSDLAASQTEGTAKTMQDMTQLLDYASSHQDAKVRYRRSDMKLAVSSDASYLSAPRARSRLGGYFYLSEEADPAFNSPPPTNNGAVLVISKITKIVVGSAAEAEIAACYHNGQEACPIRVALEFMGWPQGTTQITTDNECAEGFANKTMKQNRTKSIDMRFYWIQDRTEQEQFQIVWRENTTNLADYFTKSHPISHHQEMRPTYLYIHIIK